MLHNFSKNRQSGKPDERLLPSQSIYRFALFAILAMSCYQFVLCFIHTKFFPISNAVLGGIEITILLAVLIKTTQGSSQITLGAVLGVLAYFAPLWAMRGEIDVTSPRNILIMIIFYSLGKQLKSTEQANKIVKILIWIVLTFAFFEYFFTDTYLKYFDILNYFIHRGVVDVSAAEYMHQNLSLNGIRIAGRNILPFLGNLRVSSIFLEAVSLGNFATIVAMWFLSLDKSEWRKNWGLIVSVVVLIIACDSRFASLSVFFLFLVRIMPLLQRQGVIALMPIVSVVVLFVVAFFHIGTPGGDDLGGRLIMSGNTILSMDFLAWFGMNVPRDLMDMGSSYTIEHFGLLLIIILWLVFTFLKIENKRGLRFRAMTAVYITSLLMVSGTSLYSSKTAALLWFLLGALSYIPSAINESRLAA